MITQTQHPSPAAHPDPLGAIQPPEPAERLTPRLWAGAALVAVLATLLATALATRRGLWLDEYYTLNAARMSFQEMIRDRLGAGHSPLYFFYARLGWLLGGGLRALRFTSAVALGGAVLALTGLAGAMGLRRCLPALWCLCLIQPYWIIVSTEYRYMMPVIALAALTAWAAFEYARAWAWRPGLGLVLSLGLLLWVHSSTQFLVFALGFFILWEGRRRRELPARLALRLWPAAAALAASLPLLYLTRHYKSEGRPRTIPHMWELVKDLNEVVFHKHALWASWLGWNIDGLILIPAVLVLGTAIWLTRRELLARGQAMAWRLLAALLAGFPLTQALITLCIRRVQGPPRYLAAFSAPATLCLAIAWNAPLAPRPRRLFRGTLLALLAIQGLGAALDLGDLHREAIQWVLAQHHGEKILVSTRKMNLVAFEYVAGHSVRELTMLKSDDGESKRDVVAELRKIFGPERRGFIYLYHDALNLNRRIDELRQKKFFAGVRMFPICGEVRVYAFIRTPAEQAWLDALPPFPRPWGPARSDVIKYDED